MASLLEQRPPLPCILPECSALPEPSLTPRIITFQLARTMATGEAGHFWTRHITTYQEQQEVPTMLSATICQAPVRILTEPPLLAIHLDATLDPHLGLLPGLIPPTCIVLQPPP